MAVYNSKVHIITWLKSVLPYIANEMGVLPPIKVLTEMKGCSYASMYKAIKELEEDGLLVSKRGYGTCLRNPNFPQTSGPKKDIQEMIKNNYTDKAKSLFVLILPYYSFNNPQHNINQSYLTYFCAGVFSACEKLKIEIVIKFYDYYKVKTDESIRAILSFIKKNPVKGIMTGSVTDKTFFLKLYQLGLPCLIVDHWPLGLNLPSLNPNHSDATKELVFVLASLKHKNIALIDRFDPGVNPEIASGYKAGLLATNLIFREDLVFNLTTSNFARQEFNAKLEILLKSENRPTAFITHNSDIAIELVKFLGRIGLKIPRDVSVLTFCSSKIEINNMVLSGIYYDWNKIGEQSVTKLLSISFKKDEVIFNDTFKFTFWPGSSISFNSFKPSNAHLP